MRKAEISTHKKCPRDGHYGHTRTCFFLSHSYKATSFPQLLHLLSFTSLSRSFAHSHSVQQQSHSMSLKSDKSRQDFYIHKKGRGRRNTHRLTQYMQSEAVFFVDKAFTHGKWGIDTEICRTLLPMRRFLPGNCERVGELQKRFS